jgi:hypothetical protein
LIRRTQLSDLTVVSVDTDVRKSFPPPSLSLWNDVETTPLEKDQMLWTYTQLRPCYTVKQVSRYLYHATFCFTILVSLHTKSSSMFHAVCLQIVPAIMKNPDNEDIIIQIEEILHLFLWPNNITTFFPFPVMFYLPCAFICWWCCNLLTSNQDLWLVRDKNVSWSLLHRIEHVLSQSVYHATSKSCMIQSNSTVYTVFFGSW